MGVLRTLLDNKVKSEKIISMIFEDGVEHDVTAKDLHDLLLVGNGLILFNHHVFNGVHQELPNWIKTYIPSDAQLNTLSGIFTKYLLYIMPHMGVSSVLDSFEIQCTLYNLVELYEEAMKDYIGNRMEGDIRYRSSITGLDREMFKKKHDYYVCLVESSGFDHEPFFK